MKLKQALGILIPVLFTMLTLGKLCLRFKTANFMERATEGSTATRRVISVDPSITMPSHSCILALDQILIVGGGNPDEWNGEVIRQAYWVKLATDTMTLLSEVKRQSGRLEPKYLAAKSTQRHCKRWDRF